MPAALTMTMLSCPTPPQKAKMDLVNVGPDVEAEKDLLLERRARIPYFCHIHTAHISPKLLLLRSLSPVDHLLPQVLRLCEGRRRQARRKRSLGGLHRPLLWLAGGRAALRRAAGYAEDPTAICLHRSRQRQQRGLKTC